MVVLPLKEEEDPKEELELGFRFTKIYYPYKM